LLILGWELHGTFVILIVADLIFAIGGFFLGHFSQYLNLSIDFFGVFLIYEIIENVILTYLSRTLVCLGLLK